MFDFDAAFSTEGVQDTLERLRHEHPHRVWAPGVSESPTLVADRDQARRDLSRLHVWRFQAVRDILLVLIVLDIL